MGPLLTSLCDKSSVTIDLTGDRCRIVGKGILGTLAVVALCALIVHYAPQLIAVVSNR